MSALTGVELSKRVAELYYLEPYCKELNFHLHEDSEKCFELMVEHQIDVEFSDMGVAATVWDDTGHQEGYAYLKITDDKIQDIRTIILQCLVKMAQERSDEHKSSFKKEGE